MEIARRSGRLVAAVAIALAVVGCRQTARTAAVGADASLTSTQLVATSDDAITSAVRRSLDADPLLGSQSFVVHTADGVVTLEGAASSLLIKQRAVALSKTLRAVRAVVDEIRVAARARPDADVRRDVEQAIRDDPALRGLPITISVRDGAVTLKGTVGSSAEKALAVDDASGVPSVVSVDDEIDVRLTRSRPDDVIARDVTARLFNDAWLDGTLVDARVSHGVVTLDGTVATLAQRERAYDDAWVDGVRGVANARVRIDPQLGAHGDRRALPPAPRTDAQVTDALEAAFDRDPRVRDAQLRATVHGGVVTLRGTVADARARASAVEDVRDTIGVAAISDELTVRGGEAPDDARIVAAARARLDHDDAVPDAKELKLRSTHGDLRVQGTLDSSLERKRVLLDLSEVSGVQRITDATTTAVPPDVLRARIDDLLAWDPLVGHDVRVSVTDDRDAILEGVASWGAARAATEDALRLGAREVEDRTTRPGGADAGTR